MRGVIAILGLVFLAGCLAGPPPAEPPDAAWATADGIDVPRLAEAHWDRLRTAGSFSHNRSSTHAIDGETRPDVPRPDWYSSPSHTHTHVDLEASRFSRAHVRVGHRTSETFISSEGHALRRKPCGPEGDCPWAYEYTRRSGPDTAVGEIDRYRGDRVVEGTITVMDDWNYSFRDADRRGGHTLYRYSAERTFDRPVHPFAAPPAGEGTLVVTDDGVIRRWEYRFTGPAAVEVAGETRTVTVTQHHRIVSRGVGETVVDRPGWVDSARDREDPRRTRRAET